MAPAARLGPEAQRGTGGAAGSGGMAGDGDTALTEGLDSEQPCQFWSVEAMFNDCPASFTYKPDIPIIGGSFELLLPGTPDIEFRGTFDGNTATGEVSSAGDVTCSAQWEAAPNE